MSQTSANIESSSDYLETMHYYGLSVRLSRNLMRTQSAAKALELSQQYLDNLHLSGFIRFLEGDMRQAAKFGNTISRELLQDVKTIRACAACKDKIGIEKEFIIIKSSLSFIFISRQDLSVEKIDKLQDILAVFIDTLDAWLENYLMRSELSSTLQGSLQSLVQSSSELILCHANASEELMSAMIAKFPVLGLQADQEDYILDIIKHAMDKHIQLIENQIKKNGTLGDTLIESVDALNNSDEYVSLENLMDDDSSVELF